MIPAAPGLIAVKPAVFVIAGVIVLDVAQLLEVLQECQVGSIVVPQLFYVLPADEESVVFGAGQVKGAVEEGALKERILLETAVVKDSRVVEVGIVKGYLPSPTIRPYRRSPRRQKRRV